MMPRSLSGETNQDSEPNLAVNPANWREMAASAFTPNPGGSGNAPIYVTTDGGSTWVLNPIVPSAVETADITLRFASGSNDLYAGILRRPAIDLAVLRTGDPTSATVMTVLESRPGVDQPYVEARTDIASGNHDRVFSAGNTPNNANFPKGVSYQRNANFSTGQLLAVDNVTPAAASIDPFFFQGTGQTAVAPVSCEPGPRDGFVVGADGWRY